MAWHHVLSVPRADTTNYHMLGGLKPEKCIFSKVLEPEGHRQGVAIAVLPP